MISLRPPKRIRPVLAVAGVFIGVLAAIGVVSGPVTRSEPIAPSTEIPSPAPNRPAAVPAPGAETGAAAAKLESLPIKGRAPKTGYDRDLFGSAWSDDVTVADGHNGCDTRNDILRRDLVNVTLKPGTNGCVVLTGVLNDPYTGTSIEFERGRTTSRQVQIDHVVALSDAWQKGAQQWDEAKRRNFANDPTNLQATDGQINEQKGDGDAATWLPPNKSYRCTYVSRIVDVKAAYGVWVTQAEHDAIARILDNCAAPVADVAVPLAPAAPPDDMYYPTCAAARAASAAPLHVGEPGYRPGLDRDNDGVACE